MKPGREKTGRMRNAYSLFFCFANVCIVGYNRGGGKKDDAL